MCMRLHRTNIEIDPAKVIKAKQITGLKTTKEVVDFALGRLSASSEALSSLFSLAGKVRFSRGYSYKRYR